MKDMYSLARFQEEHAKLYEQAAGAYHRVYDRLGSVTLPIGEDTIYGDEEKRLVIM